MPALNNAAAHVTGMYIKVLAQFLVLNGTSVCVEGGIVCCVCVWGGGTLQIPVPVICLMLPSPIPVMCPECPAFIYI